MRQTLALVAGLCLAVPVGAASWADAMFKELSKDFGAVPRGPTLSHPFHLVNNTGQRVVIAGCRVSCGCVTATPAKQVLAPGEETAILTTMDTRKFSGVKSVTIYVSIAEPRSEEVRLWVQANARDDVAVNPDSLAFGQIKRGTSPTASCNISFYGHGQWRITKVASDSNYVQPALKEIRREGNEVSYQLTARLRPDAPVGKWYSDIWLTTNNNATARIRVPLTVEIQSNLTISPAAVNLGPVKIGAQVERKVIVRGVKPFKITGIKGTDESLKVSAATEDSKPVHVLTVQYKPATAGNLNRTIHVLTDLEDEGEIEFQATAQAAP